MTVSIFSGTMAMLSPPLLMLLCLSKVAPAMVELDVVVVVVDVVVVDEEEAVIVGASIDVRLDDLLRFLLFLVCEATIKLCRTANGGIEEWSPSSAIISASSNDEFSHVVVVVLIDT